MGHRDVFVVDSGLDGVGLNGGGLDGACGSAQAAGEAAAGEAVTAQTPAAAVIDAAGLAALLGSPGTVVVDLARSVDYRVEIARIHATRAGTGEISYYGALTGALNAAGERLKPRVFCVPNLRNRGAGFPDMGLFVAARGQVPGDWPLTQPPDRGVVEVDDIPADLSIKLGSDQVRRYLSAHGLVLVTNYRDFVLLGGDARGQPERRESFSFGCEDAAAFFALARSPRRPAGMAARFAEFLERVLLHQAPLARPEEVAFFLASYARDALARVEEQANLPAFADLRNALQEALGLQFQGPKGEHLFRSTLVQTLFYGLFSAWVEVAQQGGANFAWRAAGWSLHVPFVDTLFQRISTPQSLKPLGLEEPLSWAAAASEAAWKICTAR